jgi:hypothetical protein
MPLLLKKTKDGLKASLKAAKLKLPHGYEIRKRKTTKRKPAKKRR